MEWEIAQEAQDPQVQGFATCMNITTMIMKITYIFLLFFLVLGSGLTSRVSFHFLVWRLHPTDNDNKLNTLHGMLKQPESNSSLPVNSAEISISYVWAVFLVLIYPCIYNILTTNVTTLCKDPPNTTLLFWVSHKSVEF